MSHGDMTPDAALHYRELVVAEARKRRREAQLIEEYGFIKDFHVNLTRNDGAKCSSFRLEELFEMFELTRGQR